MLLYLVLQDVNYCIRLGFACSTRPHNNRTMLYDFRFVLMLVCFSAQIFCRRLARSTHKLDFPFSNFGFLVLHSHKRYVMFKCIAVLADQDRARDPISVAYFNQVALFLILTIYLSYLDQVLLLQQQCLLYIGIKLKKHFKNACCEFYEQFSCRTDACCSYKAFEQNAKFVCVTRKV